MMVVIVVSRRVGQVTLAVSERTSCRNLNGLKAIVDMIRSVKAIFGRIGNPNSPPAPSPRSKDEPPSGLDCSGEIKAAPDIRTSGPAAGGGYVLRKAPKVKAGEPLRRTPFGRAGAEPVRIRACPRRAAGLETLSR